MTREQLQEQKQRLEQQLQKIEDQEREERQQREREEREKVLQAEENRRREERTAIRQRIVDEVRKLVPPGVTIEHGIQILGTCVTIEEQFTSVSSWRSKPTGKYKITVGDYGERVSYPPTKEGHSYPKIAKKLIELQAVRQAQRDAEAKKKADKESAKGLLAELATRFPKLPETSFNGYESLLSSEITRAYPAGGGRQEFRRFVPEAGKIYVNLGSKQLTVDQAEKLIRTLIEIGLVKEIE